MPKGFTEQDAALLDALGVEAQPQKVSRHTAREERIIAGFEEIQRFVDSHGRAPERGGDRDVFERLYAVRLDRILEQDECRTILAPLDRQGLLSGGAGVAKPLPDAIDDDALLAELGVDATAADITELHHVRSSAEKRAAEEIASRARCEDFERFRSLFEQLQSELDAGHPPDTTLRAEVGDRARPVFHCGVARKPTSPRWERSSLRSTATRMHASA